MKVSGLYINDLVSILYNIPDNLLNKLQLIQNNAARIVKKANRYCHITPLLQDLHWLPIKFRIQFKLLLLVFKSIHGEGPAYLASMLEEYRPSRRLRSADQSRLREFSYIKSIGRGHFQLRDQSCGMH